MKNNIFLIIILISTFYSCAVSVRDSESGYQESDFPSVSETSLMDEFEEVDLEEESLEAFEKRSIEMANDFIELVQVINNENIDPTLRENANKQLNELFVNNQPNILINGAEVDNLALNTDSLTFIAQKPFVKTEEGYYYNELQSNQLNDSEEKYHIQSVLRRKEKLFGDQKKMIWEVLIKRVNIQKL